MSIMYKYIKSKEGDRLLFDEKKLNQLKNVRKLLLNRAKRLFTQISEYKIGDTVQIKKRMEW